MNLLNRREALRAMACGCGGVLLGGVAAGTRPTRMGLVIYALGIHQRARWEGRHPGLAPSLAFLEEAHRFGAGGIQCSFAAEDVPHVKKLRRRAEELEMHVEASLDPPRDPQDVERFKRDLRVAQEAGASLARTVIMPGRRYEQFTTLADFEESERHGRQSLEWAEPVLARHRFRLAVENHKDERVAEKLQTLRRVGSEWVGLCVDVANNFALMEDPLETARAFAPFVFTVHIKDMVVREYPEGWLLADVALGDGVLDLKAIVEALRQGRPGAHFNLETITRDAIKLPVRTDGFWATLPGARTAALDRASALVKARPGVVFPLNPSELPLPRQLEMERLHIERSLAYAREHLGL